MLHLLPAFVLLASIQALDVKANDAPTHFPLISHRQQLQRRRLSLTNTSTDAPLYQGKGTHYIDIYVGTPNSQPQTLIVDTGSEWTAFPCVQGCCGQHTDDEFDRQQSETFLSRSCKEGCRQKSRCGHDNTCPVQMKYAEGSSWTAYEAEDQVSLTPTSSSFPMRFGCQTQTTRLFRTQLADGIMGMDDGPLSMWRQAGVGSFSLCFSGADALEEQAGVLTLGGYDDRLLLLEMQWAKRIRRHGGYFFHVAVRDLYFQQSGANATTTTPVEGFNADAINAGGVLVDSGSTDTYFAASLGRAFRKTFDQLTGHKWSDNLQLSLEQVQALPNLMVQLEGISGDNVVAIEVPPLHYFEPNGENNDGVFVPSMFSDEPRQSTLGANILRGHNVHFASDKIGFGKSRCNYQDVVAQQQQLEQEQQQSHSIKIETPEPNSSNKEAAGGGLGITLIVVAVVGAIGGLFIARRARKRSGPSYNVIESQETKAEIEII